MLRSISLLLTVVLAACCIPIFAGKPSNCGQACQCADQSNLFAQIDAKAREVHSQSVANAFGLSQVTSEMVCLADEVGQISNRVDRIDKTVELIANQPDPTPAKPNQVIRIYRRQSCSSRQECVNSSSYDNAALPLPYRVIYTDVSPHPSGRFPVVHYPNAVSSPTGWSYFVGHADDFLPVYHQRNP